jgi:PAS domain S-box-containing protein
MSLRTRLRISIVALAAVVVIALSVLYLYDFTRLAFHDAQQRALLVGNEVRNYVSERVNEDIGLRHLQPRTPDEFRDAAADIIRTDPRIARRLRESRASYDAVLNVVIIGAHGPLVAADPGATSEAGYPVYDFDRLRNRNTFANLFDLFFRREDYATSVPIGIVGATQASTPVFYVKVTLRSVLLSNLLEPAFYKLASGFFFGLAGAMFLGALLPNLFFRPLQRVTRIIESIASGDNSAPEPQPRAEAAEFAEVQSKLSVLGQQFRGAKQDAMELRRNIDQLLQRLEEAVLLFDSAGRLLMAGRAVERLIGAPPQELVGRTVEQVFGADVSNGEIVDAVRLRRTWRDHLITLGNTVSNRIRALVSIEPLETAAGGNVGTLITLRDADTRRQLELQLDVSSRLAAVSRLTSGVAHEIKNPLNAMALHLEMLRSKLDDASPEVDVISREIKRLDHVVKTFLSFNKPLELHMDSINLSALAEEIASLVEPDAKVKRVTVQTRFAEDVWINGDRDLIHQAVLNVVVNGIEAMTDGGELTVATDTARGECAVVITDTGPGIPPEVQDKIFNLYYSTKQNGSGIGLAMTFRVVQMHGGTIDLVSEQGKGASFRLRFAKLTRQGDEPLLKAAGSGRKI